MKYVRNSKFETMRIRLFLLMTMLLFINFKSTLAQFDNVDLFTGTLQVNIPITEVKLKDFTLPVSLSYSASGIRVSDKASWVGLGWNLNTGGSIHRLVRGKIDDDATDTEPDIFEYSFGTTSGKFIVNKDKTVDLVPFNNLRITPEYAEDRLFGFRILDEDGNAYFFFSSIFTSTSSSQYVCYLYDLDGDGAEETLDCHTFNYYSGKSYLSWNLSKIITKNKEEIQFNYAPENVTNSSYKYSFFSSYHQDNTFTSQRLESISAGNMVVQFVPSAGSRLDEVNSRSLDEIIVKQKKESDFQPLLRYKFSYSYNVNSKGTTSAFKRLMLDKIYESSGSNFSKNPPYEFHYIQTPSMPQKDSKAQDLWGFYNGIDVITNTEPAKLEPTIYIYPDEPTDPYRVMRIPNYTGKEFIKEGANRLPNFEYAKALSLESLTTPQKIAYNYSYESHKYRYQNVEYEGGGLRIRNIAITGLPSPMQKTFNYVDYENNGICAGKLIAIPIYAYYSLKSFPKQTDPTSLTEAQMYDKTTIVTANSDVDISATPIVYNMVEIDNGAARKTRYSFNVPFTFNENNVAHSTPINEKVDFTIGYGVDYFGTYKCTESADQRIVNCEDPGVLCNELFSSYVTRNAYFKRLKDPVKEGYNIYPFPPQVNYDWKCGQLLKQTMLDAYGKPMKQVINTYEDFFANGTSSKKVNGTKKGEAYYLYDHADCITCGWPTSDTHCAFESDLGLNGEWYKWDRIYGPSFISNYQILTGVASKLKTTTVTTYDTNRKELNASTTYTYNKYGQIASVSQSQSDGSELIAHYKYPKDFSFKIPLTSIESTEPWISNLIQLNCISSLIETYSSIKRNGEEKVINGQVITYNYIKPTPYKIYIFNTKDPILSFTPSNIKDVLFKFDTHYKLQTTFDRYDENNNLRQSHTQNGLTKSTIWGYNKTIPIAIIDNAAANEVYFTSFEDQPQIQTSSPFSWSRATHKNGNYSLYSNNKTAGEYTYFTPFLDINNTTAKKYKYSVWVLSFGPTVELHFFMKPNSDDNYYSSGYQISTVSTSQYAKWVLLQGEVTVPANMKRIYLRMDNNQTGEVWFDDVRLYPADARMTTYTYEPLIGKTSETDDNHQSVSYEYDEFGRLTTVRDNNNDVLKRLFYNISK